MLDCHINAFLIKPGRVLGRKLKPLTLRHYWILEAVNSPYVWNQAPAYKDMVFAVFILSFPAGLGIWLLMHPRILAFLFDLWGRKHKSLAIESDLADFAEYWKAYTARPSPYVSKGSTSRESCLPVSVKIAWAIMGKVGERQAWSMPLPLASSYFTAELEWNGSEFSTERDKAMAELNDEGEKEARNG